MGHDGSVKVTEAQLKEAYQAHTARLTASATTSEMPQRTSTPPTYGTLNLRCCERRV